MSHHMISLSPPTSPKPKKAKQLQVPPPPLWPHENIASSDELQYSSSSPCSPPAPSCLPTSTKPAPSHLTFQVLGLLGYPIAPFLSLKDLFRLSETAKWLKPYQGQLLEAKLVKRPGLGLLSVLAEQKRLDSLQVSDRSLVHLVLESLRLGYCKKLRVLNLSRTPLTDDDARRLRTAIEGGYLRGLEELKLSHSNALTSVGVAHITTALERRACPQLRRLHLCLLDKAGQPGPTGDKIASLIRSDSIPNLEVLYLHCTPLGSGGLESVVDALQFHTFANLRRLSFYCEGPGMDKLATLLKNGTFSVLDGLCFTCSREMDTGGLQSVMEALSCPQAPKLKVFDLYGGSNFNQNGARTLAKAIAKWPALIRLQLAGVPIGDEGLLFLVKALIDGGCRDLRLLCLSQTGIQETACRALAKLFRKGFFQNLEKLKIDRNLLRDEGIATLARSFRSGATPSLRCICMQDVFAKNRAVKELATSLLAGACPKLKNLKIKEGNPEVCEDTWEELKAALAVPDREVLAVKLT